MPPILSKHTLIPICTKSIVVMIIAVLTVAVCQHRKKTDLCDEELENGARGDRNLVSISRKRKRKRKKGRKKKIASNETHLEREDIEEVESFEDDTTPVRMDVSTWGRFREWRIYWHFPNASGVDGEFICTWHFLCISEWLHLRQSYRYKSKSSDLEWSESRLSSRGVLAEIFMTLLFRMEHRAQLPLSHCFVVVCWSYVDDNL